MDEKYNTLNALYPWINLLFVIFYETFLSFYVLLYILYLSSSYIVEYINLYLLVFYTAQYVCAHVNSKTKT